MNELIDLLHRGNYSCVVKREGEVHTFTNHGVVDLYNLYAQAPEVLIGSIVADKVVGKGAAALMVLGGVHSVYADVISEEALNLFQTYHVDVSYAQRVEGIINRRKDGPCPVEHLCKPLHSLNEMLVAIRGFQETHTDLVITKA